MQKNRDRILVIDETDSSRGKLIPGLSQAGFSVALVPDFTRALFALQIINPDMIVLSHISDESLEMCYQLRTEYLIPVILVGNDHSSEIWEKALVSAEAEYYVRKPFDMDEVVARIRAILRRYKKNKDEIRTAISY